MSFNNNNIQKITIFATLKGGLGGVKFLAKVQKNDNKQSYIFIEPPKYLLNDEIPEYIADAAIAKYGYELLEEEVILNSEKELIDKLREIQKGV